MLEGPTSLLALPLTSSLPFLAAAPPPPHTHTLPLALPCSPISLPALGDRQPLPPSTCLVQLQ